MTNPVYESMARVPIFSSEPAIPRGWKDIYKGCVRVWRTEESLDAANAATNDDVRELVKAKGLKLTKQELALAVVALGRVAAVEVVDECGDGVLFYPDWT